MEGPGPQLSASESGGGEKRNKEEEVVAEQCAALWCSRFFFSKEK